MGRPRKDSNQAEAYETVEAQTISEVLVMSVSELNQLTDQQKQEFRANGGTTTEY
jgi:hypothetical protein